MRKKFTITTEGRHTYAVDAEIIKQLRGKRLVMSKTPIPDEPEPEHILDLRELGELHIRATMGLIHDYWRINKRQPDLILMTRAQREELYREKSLVSCVGFVVFENEFAGITVEAT